MLPTKIDITSLEDETLDAEGLFAAYKELTKAPVFRPVIVESQDTEAPASKYFGAPWLAKEEQWPELHGKKATFVLQIDVATLPAAQAAILGGTGLVQLFYETTGAGSWDNSSLVRLVHPEGADSSCEEAVVLAGGNENWSPKVITSWEADLDYPRYEHLVELSGDDLEEIGENLEVEPSELLDECIQGDKLGGWPIWTQGVETPSDSRKKPMHYVMQLDAGCFFDGRKFPANAPELFAGDGTGHIFVSASDPSELKFLWACG